jgi:hypothetical protein
MGLNEGTQIIWDAVTKEVLVIFGAEVVWLPGRFSSRAEAFAAVEDYSRKLGWDNQLEERVQSTPDGSFSQPPHRSPNL